MYPPTPFIRCLTCRKSPGKKVGVVGMGGLGYVHDTDASKSSLTADVGTFNRHYAIQFARALGSEKVVLFSHSSDKKVSMCPHPL